MTKQTSEVWFTGKQFGSAPAEFAANQGRALRQFIQLEETLVAAGFSVIVKATDIGSSQDPREKTRFVSDTIFIVADKKTGKTQSTLRALLFVASLHPNEAHRVILTPEICPLVSEPMEALRLWWD